MKKLLCLLLVATALFAKDNSVSKPEADDGWILLFDGESLFGWTLQGGGRWQATGGQLSPATDNGYLQSNSAFSDFTLKFDYRGTADADCSVVLRAAPDGDPKETGYQLQIGDAKSQWPTGSIVDHFKADPLHPAPSQWHSVEAALAGDHISVKLDGRAVADGKNSRARGGYVDLSCSKAGKAQFRNVMLRPSGMNALFNGSDLANWKAVAAAPPKKAGMFKKMIGGGGKQKEAEWSVAGGAIHAQAGQGQLETTAMYDDFVLQAAVRINSKDKNNHPKSAIYFRGDAGQLFTGYAVDVMNAAKNGQPMPGGTGGIQGLASPKRAEGSDNQFVTTTIAARGRHIQVWADGYPVSDFQDTRAEGTSPQKDARTTAGTISLQSPDEKANLDFRRIQVAQLPKTLGKGPAQATAIPAPTPVPAVAPSGQPGYQLPPPDPNKPRIAQLMSQAIATNDPQQQLQLYAEVIRLDPSNQAAFTGHQQAQQKIDEIHAKEQQAAQQTEQANQSETDKQTKGEEAKQQAETSFLNGDFKSAQSQISIAESLLSGNPEVSQLRSRIDAAIAARDRIRYFATGAGAIALIGIIVLYFRSRGQKEPYLEVVDGLDKGKRYNLDQDIVHIGAVPQDGGNKNEIVVRDVERMISRFHCEIHKHNGKFFLVDCNSANGTSVDNKRVSGKPVQLKSGARLELAGTCTLRLGFEKRKS